MQDPEKILVRMPNWIGDIVMATPLLGDLRARYPEAHITAATPYPDLLAENPHADVIVLPSKRVGRYDLGILTTNSFSSAWYFWRSHIERRIGFANEWRSPLLTDAVPFPEKRETQHLVKTYKALLAPLGIPESNRGPELFAQPIDAAGTFVGINPCAAYGSAKCWLPERFRALTLRLLESDPDLEVVFFGSGEGVEQVAEICQGLPSRVHNFAGTTSVYELMRWIARCNLFITNDSGPMHIADALGTPLVAIFGSTSAVKTGPYNGGEVVQENVDCAPCFLRTCPIDFRCMTGISVDRVFEAARKKLCEASCLTP